MRWRDYVALNISSPNTAGLRELQLRHRLPALLVKISPDLTRDELRSLAQTLLDSGIDGVISTNSTTSRPGLAWHPLAKERGGLSGACVTPLSLAVVRELADALGGRLPIIASGGVMRPADAENLIRAGASLVQLYSGLVYSGPSLIAAAARAIERAARR